MGSIEFGAEDGSRGDVDYFIEYFKAGLAAGGTRPAWPDTVGTLTPEATRWYCAARWSRWWDTTNG